MRSGKHRAARFAVLAIAFLLPSTTLAAEIPASGTLDLATQSDARYSGLGKGAATGFDVAAAGDVNGDGVADTVVGAPRANPADREDAGSAFVVFGRPGDTGGELDLSELGDRGFRVNGAAAGDMLGWSVDGAGDVNGDGLADVLVGARASQDGRPGAAYLVFGKKDAGTINLAAPGAAARRFAGVGDGDLTGFAVAFVPDLDGDGHPDIAIGAPRVDLGADAEDAGAVYVVRSGATGADLELGSLGSAGFRLTGEEHSFAGWAVDGSA